MRPFQADRSMAPPAKASDDFKTINDLINPLNDFFTIANLNCALFAQKTLLAHICQIAITI